MDRFDDMRARGGAGGGGSIDLEGSEATGIAQMGMSAGDRFVGVATGETPVLATAQIEGNSVMAVSDDLSVYVPYKYTLSKTDTTLPISIRNENGMYETINVSLPPNLSEAMTNANSQSTVYVSGNVVINEDGSLIMIWGGYSPSPNSYIIVIHVDKEAKTASSILVQDPFGEGGSVTGVAGVKGLRENFVFVTTSTPAYCNKIYSYSNGEFREIYSVSSYANGPAWYKGGMAIIGNKIIASTVYSSSAYIYSVSKSGSLHASKTLTAYDVKISSNGMLGSRNKAVWTVYDINPSDLTLTKVWEITNGSGAVAVYPDIAGKYVLTAFGIYDMFNGSKVFSTPNESQLTTVNGAFNSKIGWFSYANSNTTQYRITDPDAGEYQIEKCNSTNITMQSGKVYGVALEDIKAGDVGKVKLLFATSPETTA